MNIEYDKVDKKWYVWVLVDEQDAEGLWSAHSRLVAEFDTRQEAEEYCSIETE